MAHHVAATVDRILAINWGGSDDRTTSRGYLMKEYLRRAAWWARTTGAEGFPFFDIAASVEPAVRADPLLVDRVTGHLSANLQGAAVTNACVNALHFAALLDAEVQLPSAPPEPFEPLLLLLERGGGFRVGGGGLIDVDTLGIPPGTVGSNLRAEPYVELEQSALDALDSPSG
ncbi:hypothetical protein [Plantactinospora sp. KBS50]|uniref:hypothetical protein n=1 Tax=Plantactinospora sp. KBS50 TaxID=2024580 RepID=UPI000BAAA4AA|nr:hypothetical protein [Plantactinospora sp. KBS50]ASW53277.1 hypothetical protein CIK06_02395 [Plantactinospora sp. KBS50]